MARAKNTLTPEQEAQLMAVFRDKPGAFLTEALDVKKNWYCPMTRELEQAVDEHQRVSVRSGHGTGKTHDVARLALKFLYTRGPATVVTTAPTGHQVKDLLWREIRSAHGRAKIPLGGKLTTTGLDLQEETGLMWFATGFATKPDTVTAEATAFQGYHNEHLLILFDEAAAILPEIWRAAEHIGAPYKRWVAIGNATSAAGEFAATFRDPTWHNLSRSVTQTMNFIAGKTVIPGLYGREYEQRIREKYGADSDEYAVRVLGEISNRASVGSYYAKVMNELRAKGLVCTPEIHFDRRALVYTVWDPGFTTAIWWFQRSPGGCRVLDYYEDSGPGVEDLVPLVRKIGNERGYDYGGHFVPSDINNNAQRIVTGKTALEVGREMNFHFIPLQKENRVDEGITRARVFLHCCSFAKEALHGVLLLEQYHERLNRRLSTEEKPVFTGTPEKDGPEHCADAFRYLSMAFPQVSGGRSTEDEIAENRRLARKYRRPR